MLSKFASKSAQKSSIFSTKASFERSLLEKSLPFAEAFARLLHPFAEVVVHDLSKDQIEAIYNPISRREVGDNSYLVGKRYSAWYAHHCSRC